MGVSVWSLDLQAMIEEDPGYPQEEGAPEEPEPEPSKQVSIPAPDPALPPSFDCDNPTHRFRFLESANQWMVRPIVEAHGWDHESGIEGFSVDKAFMVRKKIPANINGQVSKDKKDANLTMEMEASVEHSASLVTTSGLDIQTVGKQLAYTLRSETRWKNAPNNKTAAGLSASLVGGSVAVGAKLEDRWKLTEAAKLVVSCGTITAKGDVAYGAPLRPGSVLASRALLRTPSDCGWCLFFDLSGYSLGSVGCRGELGGDLAA